VQAVIDLHERVLIERQRMLEVGRIREEQMRFIDSQGKTEDVLAIVTGIFTAISSVPSGKAHQGITVFNNLLGVAVEASERELARIRELRALEADLEVQQVNSLASIKEMLVEMAQLDLNYKRALLQRAEARLRKDNLLIEAKNVVQEHELRESQLTDLDDANDPTLRVLRSNAVLEADRAFRMAQVWMYRAARNFEFQTDSVLPSIETTLVPARRASTLVRFATCLQSEFERFRADVGTFQEFTEEFSLRRDIWGIVDPVVDPVSGREVSVRERFQRRLLNPSHLSPSGEVVAFFATSVNPDNRLFSSGICIDTVDQIRVKLIGDRLGDDQARIKLEPRGTSFLRSCLSEQQGAGDIINEYEFEPKRVELIAGVNQYAESAPDIQLAGRPVANSEWKLVIPGPVDAPTNDDLDVTRIEDIVFEITHSGVSLGSGSVAFQPSCP
jgi:hypothetical protein